MKWIIAQKWSHVLFLNYEVEPQIIQETLPEGLEVDTFEGKAYLSIVPFYMSHVRFPYTPALPFSSLWELNLRTYVQYKGQKGIYFYTLDTNHRLGQFIATRFFHLPYRVRAMNGKVNSLYNFDALKSLELRAIISEEKTDTPFDRWLTERYSLFTDDKDKIYRGDVIHKPWKLQKATLEYFNDQFSKQFGFSSEQKEFYCLYAREINVHFKPFKKMIS